ncbi:MAG: hydrogenase iron-sulfur subunit [Candidatus Bathyarchaeia archaeon]
MSIGKKVTYKETYPKLRGKVVKTIASILKKAVESCKACGLCIKVCPYNAITLNKELKRIEIIETACGGCGTCSAKRPFDALTRNNLTDEQINAVTENDTDKKIVAFCCNWCAYASANFVGASRIRYPLNVRIIRTMYSGRVAPKFIERSFAKGIAAVLVAGCHLGNCYYISANYSTERSVEQLWKKVEQNS